MEKNNILKVSSMEIINLGLESLYDSVKTQNIPAIHVDWRPPAGGNLKLIEILDRLKALG